VISPQMKSLRALVGRSYEASFPYFENDAGIPTYRKGMLAGLPRIPYGNYWLYTRVARKLLADYVREHGKPDIIHAHSAILGGAAAAKLGQEWNIPVVLTEHSSAFARNLYMRWQLRLASDAAEAAGACIAVSPALGGLLGKRLVTPNVSWKWVPNVVADRFGEPEWSTRADRPVRYLSLALMTENKGQKDLLRAFREAVGEGVEGELWLAGNGPIRSELEQLAHELGIANRVRFPGLIPPDEVPALLKEVDVMVISSHYETFGVVAAEALMAGVPVIATRCGGPECIVTPGDGFLVPVKQPAALAEAMLNISETINDFDPREIASRARDRFSEQAVAEQLTHIYNEVLEARS